MILTRGTRRTTIYSPPNLTSLLINQPLAWSPIETLYNSRKPMDDERRGALLWESFQKFRNSLHDGEKMDFSRATASDVLERVRVMDEGHRRSSTSRRAVDAIYPLVQFLDRNSRAVDCLIQVQPLSSAIIWAMCRILIEVSPYYWTTFNK